MHTAATGTLALRLAEELQKISRYLPTSRAAFALAFDPTQVHARREDLLSRLLRLGDEALALVRDNRVVAPTDRDARALADADGDLLFPKLLKKLELLSFMSVFLRITLIHKGEVGQSKTAFPEIRVELGKVDSKARTEARNETHAHSQSSL